MTEIYTAILAVTITIINDGKILLVKRKNTGFMDGYYATPGGHVDPHESITAAAVRELKEETDLETTESDLKLFRILQDENEGSRNYITFRFITTKWSGTPKIGEPDKSADVGFFDIKKPPKLSPYVKRDLEVIDTKSIVFDLAEPGDYYR